MKLFSLIILIVTTASAAQCEILKYTDNRGNTYFVDSAEKVPEAYKNQAGEKAQLPGISKMQAREYEKVTPSAAENKPGRMEIFVTSWCPHCKDLESYLASKHVKYNRYDIEKDSVGKSKYDQIGVRGVPVIKLGSTVISGFDRAAVDELIGR